MRKRIVLALVVMTAVAGLLLAQTENSRKVREAVAPLYPPVAIQARLVGTTNVLVEIGDAGNVLTSVAQSGHPLFKAASLDAAKKWKFESGSGNAQATLTFNFTLDSNELQNTIFKPPYTVEVHAKVPPETTTYTQPEKGKQ